MQSAHTSSLNGHAMDFNTLKEIVEKSLDNKKPEDYSSGTLNRSVAGSLIVDASNTTIFDPLINNNGKNMSEGFIKIPRSLFDDPLWLSLSPKIKVLFLKILELACYKAQKFDDFGTIIDLKPGQFCMPLRDLAHKLGSGFDKSFVERSLVKLNVYGFSRHEVRHKKTIITITYPACCAQINYLSETAIETNVRQTRDKLETQKKKEKKEKKEKNTHIPTSSVASESKIFFRELVSLTQKEYDDLQAEYSKEFDSQFFDEMLDMLDDYKGAHNKSYVRDYKILKPTGWAYTRVLEKRSKKKSAPKSTDENKTFAQEIERDYMSPYGKIEASNRGIEFIMNGQGSNNFETIGYEENGFQDRVRSLITKKNFKKKQITAMKV